MIEINVEFPQREVIQATAEVNEQTTFTSEITINAKPEITGVTASVDNSVGIPYVNVTPTGTGTEYSFDLAFHNLKGEQGIQGETGQDGFSPTASIEQTSTGATITVTDAQGTTTADLTNGADGAAATISVGTVTTGAAGSSATVTNSGTSSAAVFDFTIPQGDKGDTGDTGATGNGIASIEKTSTAGLVDTYTITYTNSNTSTFNVTNGQNGTNGNDGYSPSASVTQTSGGATISITDKNGTTTANIANGAKGDTGNAATIAVGTTSTGAAGTNASVTNSGTSSAAVFNFTIPKGDTGATGTSVTGVTLISTVGLDKTYRMAFSNNTYFDYVVKDGAAGATTWGGISGTLSNQTDLQNALDNRYVIFRKWSSS